MSDAAQKSDPSGCPYVGTRPYDIADSARFFGRAAESQRLLDLVVAERLVLLHSPSGAGKTSLVKAGLLPRLPKEGITLRAVLRVNQGAADDQGRAPPNPYVYSVIRGLDEALPKERRLPLEGLRAMTLPKFFEEAAGGERGDQFLFFDQFEEILVGVASEDHAAREEFFRQLGKVLHDPQWHAVFAIREEHVAALDPYLHSLPHGLSCHLRLELLGKDAARDAIVKPAAAVDRTIPPELVDGIVKDLCRVQVMRPDGSVEPRDGLYVEPVHLQVVCLDLWERWLVSGRPITEEDARDLVKRTDDALARYYNAKVEEIARVGGVQERDLRAWFEHHLITRDRVRATLTEETGATQGLDNKVIGRLADAYLVRSESRRGVTRYELSHDRFIEPIQRSNAAWFKARLTDFQRAAAAWAASKRPDDMRVTDEVLDEGRQQEGRAPTEFNEVERDFLRDCLQARGRQRYKRMAAGGLVVAVLTAVIATSTVMHRRELRAAQDFDTRLREAQKLQLTNSARLDMARSTLRVASTRAPQRLPPAAEREELKSGLSAAALLRPSEDRGDQAMVLRGLTALVSGALTRRISQVAPIGALAAAPDGRIVIARVSFQSGMSSALIRWDTRADAPTLARPVRAAETLAYSPDLTHVIVRTGVTDVVVRSLWTDSVSAALPLLQNERPWWRSDGTAFRLGASPRSCFDTRGQRLTPAACLQDRFSTSASPGTRGAVTEGATLWNSATGQVLLAVAPVGAPTMAPFAPSARFAFAEDGSTLALASNDAIQVLRVRAGGRGAPPGVERLEGSTRPSSLDITRDGGRLVAVERGFGPRIWSVADRRPSAMPSTGWGSARSIAFAANGERVFVGGSDGTIQAWDGDRPGPRLRCLWNPDSFRDRDAPCSSDAGELAIAARLDEPGALVDLMGAPPSERLLDARRIGSTSQIAARTAAGVSVWDPSARTPRWSPSGMALDAACDPVSADGTRRLVFERGAIAVQRVAPSPERPVVLEGWSGEVRCAVLDRAGDRAALLTRTGGVFVWSTGAPREPLLRGASLSHAAECLALSANGATVATATRDGWTTTWLVGPGAVPTSFPMGIQAASRLPPRVLLSPDGSYLLTIAPTGALNLRSVPGGQTITLANSPTPDPDASTSTGAYAFSPDGQLLAGTLFGRDIALWRVATGELIRTLAGHTGLVTDVAFSANGAQLVTTASNSEVNLWDLTPQRADAERLLGTFFAPYSWATFARFMPGDRLLVGGPSGMVIYPTDLEGLLQLAQRLVDLRGPGGGSAAQPSPTR